MQRWRPYLLSAASGLLLVLSFPPFGFAGGLCAFVALVPMLIALENEEKFGRALRITYAMMFIWSLGATYWVGGWKGEGSVDPFLISAGVALALLHPFFLVIPALMYNGLRKRLGRITALVLLPIVWIGFEYGHSLGDLSFPWLNLYNTQTYNTYYIQFIEFTGSYGLSLVILLVNILVYCLIRYNIVFGKAIAKASSLFGIKKQAQRIFIAAIAALLILPYLYGAARIDGISSSKNLRVTIIQPNFNPWDKWSSSSSDVIDSMYRSSRTALRTASPQPDLLLWPETAIPIPITHSYYSEEFSKLQAFVRETNAAILTGIPDREEYTAGVDSIPPDAKVITEGKRYYRDWNSAILFSQGASGIDIQRYHKQKLVPFGERVPFVDAIPVLGDIFKWGVGLGSWNRGESFDVFALAYKGNRLTQADTAHICTMICYESIYPDYIREFTKRGAELITVVTNDGWYGKSSGPYQHNRYAVLRAVENRRWIARSANTGVSSVIDPYGRIAAETELFTAASLSYTIPLLTQKTFYTETGDYIAVPFYWITLALLLYLFVMHFVSRRKNNV